jgi:hypothetical protein
MVGTEPQSEAKSGKKDGIPGTKPLIHCEGKRNENERN